MYFLVKIYLNMEDSKYHPEKRKYPRKKHITGVEYQVLANPRGTGIIKNISEGGMCAILDKYLAEGTIIRLSFAIQENTTNIPIETVAKVLRVEKTDNGYETGLQFMV